MWIPQPKYSAVNAVARAAGDTAIQCIGHTLTLTGMSVGNAQHWHFNEIMTACQNLSQMSLS